MTTDLLQGDCLEVLRTLPDCSVQCVVTSPPYYGLRDYGVDNQIGLEATPEAYVEKLVAVFREVRRVLKDDGTVWLVIGDSYAGSGGVGNQRDDAKKGNIPHFKNPNGIAIIKSKRMERGTGRWGGGNLPATGDLKPKDLIGIPWLVAFALRADGWWLRQDIIWAKPNPMPESVTDRCTKSHEYIFLLTKRASYYYDAEAIAEPVAYSSIERLSQPTLDQQVGSTRVPGKNNGNMKAVGNLETRNRRSVWTVTTKPYSGAHFATFPPDLIEPCILAGTSEKGECSRCGKAWVKVVDKTPPGKHESEYQTVASGRGNGGDRSKHGEPSVTTTLGWQPQCECNAGDPVPQTVLDPFNGSGTTGQVAIKWHRNYIGIELNPEYIELTRRRLAAVQVVLI